MSFTLSVLVLTTLIADELRLFVINLNNGGYAGSVYGYIVVWIGTLATFTTMGELSSMYWLFPGSLYIS